MHSTRQHPCPQRDPCPRRGQPPSTSQAPAVQQGDWAKFPPRLPLHHVASVLESLAQNSPRGTSNEAQGSTSPSEHGCALVSYCKPIGPHSVARGTLGSRVPFHEQGFCRSPPRRHIQAFSQINEVTRPLTLRASPPSPRWGRRGHMHRCGGTGVQGLALRHLVVAQSDSWASVFILEACGASGSLGAPDTALPEHTSPRGG